MVGKFGDIVFETSDKRILSFKGFKQTVSGRWSRHSIIGRKEVSEFNGPGNRKITFSITLNAIYGVRPREMLEKIEDIIEKGYIDYLIIGGRPVGNNRFYIASMSEDWNTIYSGGELAIAIGTVTLEEYI